jgi:hypothetical protein
VDFVRLRQPGAGLCIYLRAPSDEAWTTTEPPQVDVGVYAWDGVCITGPFLTHAALGEPLPLPLPLEDGGQTQATAEAADIAIYVAGVKGYASSYTLGYTLDVVATGFPARCPLLDDGELGEPRQ